MLRDAVGREIYTTLRERIAPGVAPTAGKLSAGHAIAGPVFGLCATALFGGLAIWNSTVEVVPGVQRMHRIVLKNIPPNAGVKVWIHAILERIGTANVVAFVLAVAACFALWLYCRRSHLHHAEVVLRDGAR